MDFDGDLDWSPIVWTYGIGQHRRQQRGRVKAKIGGAAPHDVACEGARKVWEDQLALKMAIGGGTKADCARAEVDRSQVTGQKRGLQRERRQKPNDGPPAVTGIDRVSDPIFSSPCASQIGSLARLRLY